MGDLKEVTPKSCGYFQDLCSRAFEKIPWLSGHSEGPLSFTLPSMGGKVDVRVVLWK